MEQVIRDGIDESFVGSDQEHTAFNGHYHYRALCGPQSVDPDLSCVKSDNRFSHWLRDVWGRLARDQNVLPCGEIQLTDALILGVSGLAIDTGTGSAFVGSPVNWGLDHAQWYISVLATQHPGLTLIDPNRFTLELAQSAPKTDEPHLLLASPGWNIYGHWIIDYVPRLYLMQQMREQSDLKLIFPRLPAWTDIFLEVFEIGSRRIEWIDETKRGAYSTLRMPSATKNGFSVAQPFAKTAWKYFASIVRERALRTVDANALPLGERVFLSRRSYGSARTIDNVSELEAIAQAKGFVLVEPEKYTILEQATIMHHARIIVGEDGSALHNVIFAQPGAHLGVIGTPDRPNLWHVSLCQSLGHSISYIEAGAAEENVRTVPFEEYTAFLDQLTH